MPNWCENYLHITGPKEELDRFINALRTNPDSFEKHPRFQFNKLHPLPKEEEKNWYDWQVNNWGTKWDIDGVLPDNEWQMNDDTYGIAYSFDTAWGPPDAFISYVSGLFPKLTFELGFLEPGVGFAGIYEVCVHKNYEETQRFEHGTEEYNDFAYDEFGWEFDEVEDDEE